MAFGNVDVDPRTANITAQSLEARIRLGRAVIVTHL
jgi:dTDP-4-amino-4,6-dideoxygalactose transaminase